VSEGGGFLLLKGALLFLMNFGLGLALYFPVNGAAMSLAPSCVALCQASLDSSGYICAVIAARASGALLHLGAGRRGALDGSLGGWRLVMAFHAAISLAGLGATRAFLAAVSEEEAKRREEAEGGARSGCAGFELSEISEPLTGAAHQLEQKGS
jgi:hypothetical protein